MVLLIYILVQVTSHKLEEQLANDCQTSFHLHFKSYRYYARGWLLVCGAI